MGAVVIVVVSTTWYLQPVSVSQGQPPMFTTVNLAVGTARVIVGVLLGVILIAMVTFASAKGISKTLAREYHPVAGLVRYLQLFQPAARVEDADETSALVAHMAADKLCPCKACVGDIWHSILWSRILSIVSLLVFLNLNFIATAWTPFKTFGRVFWGSVWGWLLGIVLYC
jgi:hypothetical protein